jgi:hypothetical protein
MRHILFSASLIVASGATVAAPLQDIYVNSRYDYSISYPAALLKAQPESDAGDGTVFDATKGTAQFRIFAGGTAPDINDTSTAAAKSAEEKCLGHHAAYRVVKPRLAAISCTIGPNILYSKTLLRDGVATTFMGTYPVKERATWDPVVAAMARSMMAGHFLN